MFRQRAAEVACFAFIAAVGVQLVASQTVTCYTSSTACTSTSVTLTGTRPAGQCCLNRGGRSYKNSTSTACTPCVVYGFFEFQFTNSTALSTTVYQKEGSQLTGYFGFMNGTFSGTHSVSFSVPDNNRYIKSFTTGVLNSAAARLQFTLNIIQDNIALQPPLSVAVSATVDGSNEFVLPFNAVILDADVVTIGFREPDYSVTEGASPPDQYPKIKLAKDKTIAQPLSVQVVPLTVDQFRPLGIPLPDGITFAVLTNPAQYIPNGHMDFDMSILHLIFTSSQTELSPNVAILNDLINEAEQQFICIVQLADPSVNASGNVIIKPPSTVIRIVDNDPIAIGFGADTYTFTKGQQIFYGDTVKLVKDDGVVSEQTFSVTVIAQPNAVDNQAMFDVDYNIGPLSELTFTITPDQQSVSIGVNIFDAGLTGTLQAKLVSTQVVNTPSYSPPHNPTTLLLILDNKVAIVGFVNGGTVVTEGEDFIECVAVTDPPPELTMRLSFNVMVELVPDTADASDIFTSSGPILGPFDNMNRTICFSINALADVYFEGNQTFTYSLTLIGQQAPVIISPNVTMVTILDNTTLTIGFDPIQYAVNKSDSYVIFGVSILGGVTIQGASVGVMFSTGDGTALAGQDYIQTAQLLSFHENTAYIPFAVGIINNGYYEDDISFQANLALQSAAGYEQFVTLSPAKTTATIIDDINGVTIGFNQTGYSFLENQRYARVSVRVLQGRLKKSVAVQFSTIRGSAVGPDDYTETDKILVYNESTLSINVDVPLVDDGLAEDNESFSAQLLAVSPSGLVTIAPATTLITIIDTNSVIIGYEKQSYQISKHQNQGRLPVKIQVLQGTLGRTVLLHVKTRDGSAIASTNYISIDSDLPAMNFSVHELTVDVSIVVNDLAEDDKVFSVELSLISPSSRVTIAPISAQVTIIDDNNVTIGFEHGSYQISKHQNQGRLPVKIQVLQGTLGRTVLLHVKTRDGSAIASTNYISIDSDLPAMNFSIHELTVNVSIIVNDLAEDDKVFSVELSLISPSSRVTIAPISAQVTIIDDNTCPLTYAAGVIWKATYENQTVQMPCNNADPKFSKATQMSRRCLPSGRWDVVDFTTCTLQSKVKTPFMMVWSSILDEVALQQQGFLMRLTDMNITYSIVNISSSTGFISESGLSLFVVLISTYYSDEMLSTVVSAARGKRQVISSITLSYAVIWPSDPCNCTINPGNVFYLCSDVQSSPCSCENSTQCQCLPPFVGDGQLCTVDSDLDGIPNNPLNCTDSPYCMKDNCPYIFNPPMEGIQRDVCNNTLKDGCMPVFDTVWNLQWPRAPLNFTYVQPCPNGGIVQVSGNTHRLCSDIGDWGPTDVTECESYLVKYLAQQVSIPNLDMAQSLEVLKDLFVQTQLNITSLLPLDLKDSAYIISVVSNLFVKNIHQHGSIEDTFIILDVVNNLLHESNLVGWQILKNVDPKASSLLLKSSETYGIYVASAINTTKKMTLSRSSIVLQASKVETKSNQSDIVFPDGTGTLFENASFLADDARIVIPGAFLLERARNSTSPIPVANMIIKNINMFLPSNNGSIFSEPVSIILSSQVAVAKDDDFASLALKTRPVSINFRVNIKTNVSTQYQCTFWDFENSYWSSEGMKSPTSNGSVAQCYSTHLTSFAVLLAVKTFPDSKALTIISYVGCGISMVSLLATIIFFLSLRKQLFEKPHNFVHLNLAIALFLAFLVFVAGVESAKHNETACKVVAGLLQYFCLSAFCWMLCEGVMLYLMLVVMFSSLKKRWWFFLLLGWMTPLLFVFIGLAARSDYYVVRNKDDNTISYCWMSTDKGTIWVFAVPVIIIMLINIIFLIMVLVVISRKGRQNSTRHPKNFKDNASTVISFLKSTILLLPILGGTWIFGLLSINQYTLIFTWLFTILNSVQGLFIFICYVLRDEKVWGRIKKIYENWSSSNPIKCKTSLPDIKSTALADLKFLESLERKF
eukprot:Em0010g151a